MVTSRGIEPRFAGSEPAVLPLDDLPLVGSGGLEPPQTCARGRWATDYPTTREWIGVSGRNRTGTGRDTVSPTGRCLTLTIETGSR